MTESLWLTTPDALLLLDYLFPVRGLDSAEPQTRKSRLYLTGCARRMWDHLPWACQALVEIAEQLAEGRVADLGLTDAAYDLVVSIQTIEHLWDQPAFVAECARVVRPGGTVVLSTPNRLTFPPGNWYHTRELTAAELTDLVAAHLRVEDVLGLRHGPRLTAWESEHGACVTAQLATPPDAWRPELTTLVRSTTYADFAIRPADDTALDLILVTTRPAQ